jgi:hypothetical protein
MKTPRALVFREGALEIGRDRRDLVLRRRHRRAQREPP